LPADARIQFFVDVSLGRMRQNGSEVPRGELAPISIAASQRNAALAGDALLEAAGISIYNLVGTVDFKQKFCGNQTAVPMISRSKYRWLARLRSAAPKIGRTVSHLAWKFKRTSRGKTETEVRQQED